MRDIIVKASIAVLLMALAPGLASAAGLGRLTVLSALGHPFSAEIELVSVSKAEMGSLSAQIAPPEAYRKANLPKWEVASVQFSPKNLSPTELAAKLMDGIPDNTLRLVSYVLAALASGRLEPARFRSYDKLRREIRYQASKTDVSLRLAERDRWRRIHREARRRSDKRGG